MRDPRAFDAQRAGRLLDDVVADSGIGALIQRGAIIAAIENDIYSEVETIIENYNDQTITHNELLKLKAYYYKKKYLQRILDRLAG